MWDLHDRPDEPLARHATAMQSRMVDEIRTHAALNIMRKKAKHRYVALNLPAQYYYYCYCTRSSLSYIIYTIVLGVDFKCSYITVVCGVDGYIKMFEVAIDDHASICRHISRSRFWSFRAQRLIDRFKYNLFITTVPYSMIGDVFKV